VLIIVDSVPVVYDAIAKSEYKLLIIYK